MSRSVQLAALLAALVLPTSAVASHGAVTLFESDSALGTALARDASGRILVGGDTGAGSGFGLVRLSASGKLDKHFGSRGIAKVHVGKSDFNDLTSVLPLPDGRILISGTVGTDNSTNGGFGTLFGVARLTGAGKLDTSFGEAGTKRFTLMAQQDNAMWSTLMPDGTVLIGGDSGDGATIYACSASFDTDFNQNPAFTPGCGVPPGVANGAYFGAALPDTGGTAVLSIGGDTTFAGATSPPAFGIGRITASGAADPSFGTNGSTVTSFPGNRRDGALMGKRPLVARPGGWIVGGTTGTQFGFVGFTSSGAIDPSFGSGGKLQVNPDGKNSRDVMLDLVPIGGNRFVAVGQGSRGLELACIDAGGKLVRSFGRHGVETLTPAQLGIGDLAQIDDALAVPGGKIVITGATHIQHYAMLVLRITSSGKLDRSFG